MNYKQAALQLLQDLADFGHGPNEYADVAQRTQDRLGMYKSKEHDWTGKPVEVERISDHERKQQFRKMLGVPDDELAYQSYDATQDPKMMLHSAIEDYTGPGSGLVNAPFRKRKREQIADSLDYQDPHVKKQVEANAITDYVSPTRMQRIQALAKSFYPAPADFVTWRGIPKDSTTLRDHWITMSPEEQRAIRDAVQAQNKIVGNTFDKFYKTYGDMNKWPWDAATEYDVQLTKLKEEEKKLYAAMREPWNSSVEDMPLYDDYGNEAFLSTSLNRDKALDFAGTDHGMYRILVPEGTPIRPVFPYSAHDEMEVLLPPRSVYKRTDKRTKMGDVPLMWMGRGRPDSAKYIGAVLPFMGAAGMPDYEDIEQ